MPRSLAGPVSAPARLVMKVWAELEREGAIPAPVPTGHARKIAVTVRPYVPVLPRMPDFSQGRCASPSVNADWWASFNQEERQAAVHVCHSCLLREAQPAGCPSCRDRLAQEAAMRQRA